MERFKDLLACVLDSTYVRNRSSKRRLESQLMRRRSRLMSELEGDRDGFGARLWASKTMESRSAISLNSRRRSRHKQSKRLMNVPRKAPAKPKAQWVG